MASKQQWGRQYTAYLDRILDLLTVHTQLGAWIGQRSYKGDYFRIFSDAFRSGFCTYSCRFDVNTGSMVRCKSQRPIISGDAIWMFARENGWIDAEVDVDDERNRNISLVKVWWDEWTYAWERNPPPRKYGRRSNASHDAPLGATTESLAALAAEALDEHRNGLTEKLEPERL